MCVVMGTCIACICMYVCTWACTVACRMDVVTVYIDSLLMYEDLLHFAISVDSHVFNQCYQRKRQLLTVAKWVGEFVEETTTTLQTSSCAHYSFQLLMKVTLLGSVCSGTGVQCVCPCIERYHCVVVILGWPHRGPLCIIDPTITSFVCHSKEARRCFVPNGPTLMYVHTYVRTCIVYMQFVIQSVYATHTTT